MSKGLPEKANEGELAEPLAQPPTSRVRKVILGAGVVVLAVLVICTVGECDFSGLGNGASNRGSKPADGRFLKALGRVLFWGGVLVFVAGIAFLISQSRD